MTIREFAKLCGVSPATCSRFFSGSGAVSQSVRLHIEEVAKKTGYCPPDTFRGRRKFSSVIAVILPHFRQGFFQDMLEKLREQAEAVHKRLIVFPCDDRKPQETLALLNAVNPLGIVMLHESMDDALADAINQRNIPTIVCGGIPIGRRFSSVHIDDMMAAYDGTNYLLELGHSKIGFLTDNSRAISSGFQRLTGCKKAFEDAGLPLPPDWILPTGMTFEDGYHGIDELLQRQPDLTAVFAFSDDLAVGTLVRLYELGKQVPEHISVLGFDDHIMARATIPPLTTIHQPLEDIARYTIERLINMQGAHDISSVTVGCTIQKRATCRSIGPSVRRGIFPDLP